MSEEFNFETYNAEGLKKKEEHELLRENVQTENPAYKEEVDQFEREFIKIDDIDKATEEFKNDYDRSYSTPSYADQSSPPQHLTLPYDGGTSNNSYLSLVLSPNLKELELMIRGLEYVKYRNPLTGKDEYTLQKIPNHPLNEYGINQIITQLKIYTSPEIKLGRKRAKDYYNAVNHVSKTITRLIYKNLKSFGMDTQEKQRNAKVFCDAIIEVVDSAYSRSIEGKENDLSRATDFRIEGRIDSFDDIPQMMNKQRREKYKN